jgi:hypothetical protein
MRPGVYRNGTLYQAKNRWYDANLMRFLENTIRPIGGWEEVEMIAPIVVDSFTGIDGTGLDTHLFDTPSTLGWDAYLNGEATWEIDSNKVWYNAVGAQNPLVGTDANVVGIEDGVTLYMDVTRPTLNFATHYVQLIHRLDDSASTTPNYVGVQLSPNGTESEPLCTIRLFRYGSGVEAEGSNVETSFSLAAGASIRLGLSVSGEVLTAWTEPAGGGSRTTHGTWSPNTSYNSSSYRRVGIRCYQSNSPVSSYAWKFDNYTVEGGGTSGYFSGKARRMIGWKDNDNASPFLGIGTNTNVYTFSEGELTDRTPAGLTTGNEDSTVEVGLYGSGKYGAFNYGEGDPAQGTLTEAASWQLDTFGDYLVGVLTSDGKCWYWDTDAATMVQMTESPTGCVGIVVTPERFIVALGGDGDPRQIKWATQEGGLSVSGDWTPAETNTAGDFILAGVGSIMCGRRGKNETLIFTDEDLFAMQYIGGLLVYSFKQVGSKCGIISRHAVATVDGKAIWMGQRGFYIYDGFVQSLPSDVSDDVFKDFNRTQRAKCFAVPMTNFGEVWFFYPSAVSQEPDKYVVYNYIENHWTNGSLERHAGIDRGAFEYPMLVDSDSVFDHERGTTRVGTPYIESGPLELGDGERIYQVSKLIPDEATLAGQELGSTQLYLKHRLYPTGSETTAGPFTMANPTSARVTARQVRLRVEELVAGDWRVGIMRALIKPSGRR